MTLAADDPRHATRRGYDLGCRCLPCAVANSRYLHDLHRNGPTRISADEVIDHVSALVASGWTKLAINDAAGLGSSTLWHIEHRQATVNRDTAERIFAVRPFETVTLDVTPLARLVERSGKPVQSTLSQAQARAWYRAVARGTVSDRLADEVAVRLLSLTLDEVYGPGWDEVAA